MDSSLRQQIVTAFAYPGSGSPAHVELLARLHFVAVQRQVMRDHPWALVLPDAAQAATPSPLDMGWQPALGIALQCHYNAQPVSAGLQMALIHAGNGAALHLDAELEQPRLLMLAGSLLRLSGRVSLRCDAGRIEIDTGKSRLCWNTTQEVGRPVFDVECSTDHEACIALLPQALSSSSHYLLNSQLGFSSEHFPLVDLLDRSGLHTGAPAQVSRLQQAIRDSLEHPITDTTRRLWMQRLCRGLLLVKANARVRGAERTNQAGSAAIWPGLIVLSDDIFEVQSALAPGEVLLDLLSHENAHQHFYLLERLFPLIRGNDASQYYSPIRGTERPLKYILLAYHAVANQLLTLSQLITAAGNQASPGMRSVYGSYLDNSRHYENTLDRSDGLTDEGEMLWRSLAARVADLRH